MSSLINYCKRFNIFQKTGKVFVRSCGIALKWKNLRIISVVRQSHIDASPAALHAVPRYPQEPRRLRPRESNWNKTGKGNIFLMGNPGSGKTSVGRLIGEKLGMPVIDIDNDFLEKRWNMSVADKLKEVGTDRFILEEGNTLMEFHCENSIVSLSGSNPVHSDSMQHIQDLGLVVYLDVDQADILRRLNLMKVDRIVGQTDGTTMCDILKYRQQFYDDSYDVRIICEEGEQLNSIANKTIKTIRSFENVTQYVSTRGGSDGVRFNDAILQGLASDGGLLVPALEFPQISHNEWMRLVPLNYRDRAVRILEKLIHPCDVHPSQLRDFIGRSLTDDKFGSGVCKIFPISDPLRRQFILELFHGPTGSFKDLALQLMPHLFHHAMVARSQESRFLVMVATSGDTGSAVAHGYNSFIDDGSLKVLVLFPQNGVSDIQKKQMISAQSEHVSVIGIDGDFDFCQSSLKQILNDQSFNKKIFHDFGFKLSVANSINWARLLAQIVYHASGYLDLVQQNLILMGQEIDVAIPTGNFGNILSAIYAKRMGLPIRKCIAASNSNNILTEFINTGSYNLSSRRLIPTRSPAIDILKSSNLERYIYAATNGNSREVIRLYQQLEDAGRFKVSSQLASQMRSDFFADWCMDDSCLDCIHDTYKETGYLVDPHTAVAIAVSKKFSSKNNPVPMLICSTAHYIKFPSDILQAINKTPISSDTTSAELLKRMKELNLNPPLHNQLSTVISSSETNLSHVVLPSQLSSIYSHITSILSH